MFDYRDCLPYNVPCYFFLLYIYWVTLDNGLLQWIVTLMVFGKTTSWEWQSNNGMVFLKRLMELLINLNWCKIPVEVVRKTLDQFLNHQQLNIVFSQFLVFLWKYTWQPMTICTFWIQKSLKFTFFCHILSRKKILATLGTKTSDKKI
jgi:hypothetical protein